LLLIVAETSALLAGQAKAVVQNMRQLNKFIAHQVRNPLSAALLAATFVTTARQGNIPTNPEELQVLREDAGTISM
jgi:signal transduction histidine kinase